MHSDDSTLWEWIFGVSSLLADPLTFVTYILILNSGGQSEVLQILAL